MSDLKLDPSWEAKLAGHTESGQNVYVGPDGRPFLLRAFDEKAHFVGREFYEDDFVKVKGAK